MAEKELPMMTCCGGRSNEYLRPAFMEAASGVLHWPEEILKAFLDALDRIVRRETWTAAIERWHHRLFHIGDGAALEELLDLANTADPDADMLVPIVLVSGLPHTVRYYRERRISADIFSGTLADLELNLRKYKAERGVWGTNNAEWLRRHFTGNLFRIGRLQFHFDRFPYPIRVFRHRVTRELAVFSEGDVTYRHDGQVDGTNGIHDPAWTSTLESVNGCITGNLICAGGAIQRETTRLPAAEWQLVLKEGDAALKTHIPADGKLTPELCQASYRQAVRFFAEHFPETEFAAIYCATWLLAPQWKELLPAESNIVRFSDGFHPFPILGDDAQTFERVWGGKPADLAEAPRDTQLQRILVEHLLAGGRIHNGAGFRLKDEHGPAAG